MERGEFSKDKMNQGYPEGLGIQVGGNAYTPAGQVLEGQYHYEPRGRSRKGRHLHADRLHAVREAALRQGLPGAHDLPRGRRPGGDRLQLVHRLPHVHGRLPLLGAPLQPDHPVLPKEEMNPVTHYLGNRPRMRGVVEKCHWCLQRTRHGRYPACVEVCPVGARKFGNLLDPESEVSKILERKNVFRLKAELNTFPKFFYFYD
jgi:ferredoxin